MGLIKLRKAILSCLLSFISVVYILRDQRQKHFGCPIKPVPAPYQNVLIFSLLKDTKMAILKPPRQILVLHKTAQHGNFIRQKKKSLYAECADPFYSSLFSLCSLSAQPSPSHMKLLYIRILAIHSISLRYKKQISNFSKFVPKLKTSPFPQQEQIFQLKSCQKM